MTFLQIFLRYNIIKRSAIKWLFFIVLGSSLVELNAQLDCEPFIADFDAVIGFSNSGIYYGTPNRVNPNTDRENHPFFKSVAYQNSALIYQGQRYCDVQVRYDIAKGELQLFPKNELELLGITLFNEFIDEFSLGEHKFIKLTKEDTEPRFYEVLLENSRFKLLKTYQKKAVEKLNSNREQYYKYRLETSFFISFKGGIEKLRSKTQLLNLFPQDKTTLQSLFKKQKKQKEPAIAVLQDWHAKIVTQDKER